MDEILKNRISVSIIAARKSRDFSVIPIFFAIPKIGKTQRMEAKIDPKRTANRVEPKIWIKIEELQRS